MSFAEKIADEATSSIFVFHESGRKLILVLNTIPSHFPEGLDETVLMITFLSLYFSSRKTS
jgi:hypothetical protein